MTGCNGNIRVIILGSSAHHHPSLGNLVELAIHRLRAPSSLAFRGSVLVLSMGLASAVDPAFLSSRVLESEHAIQSDRSAERKD
ncbi:hypothetical protein M413DRAFT_33163 [Hebeloma cylindrosporum]|uniref:Uncharacterized protein n=1 Tax=Hebeloma cylindrosporum TaxID=76867 RepID=A0A0C3BTD4_HEBCY|nr:hypothetical protein M413DRAFT_33163 [Hebeloma cylindrosporum h7]